MEQFKRAGTVNGRPYEVIVYREDADSKWVFKVQVDGFPDYDDQESSFSDREKAFAAGFAFVENVLT